jgi:hypothetical protein
MKSLLLLLFLFGLASFSCFFLISGHPKWLVAVGWLMCLSAYIGMLSMFYKRKARVPMLMRWVEYGKQPVLYKLVYLYLLLAGVFVAVVACAANFDPT